MSVGAELQRYGELSEQVRTCLARLHDDAETLRVALEQEAAAEAAGFAMGGGDDSDVAPEDREAARALRRQITADAFEVHTQTNRMLGALDRHSVVCTAALEQGDDVHSDRILQFLRLLNQSLERALAVLLGSLVKTQWAIDLRSIDEETLTAYSVRGADFLVERPKTRRLFARFHRFFREHQVAVWASLFAASVAVGAAAYTLSGGGRPGPSSSLPNDAVHSFEPASFSSGGAAGASAGGGSGGGGAGGGGAGSGGGGGGVRGSGTWMSPSPAPTSRVYTPGPGGFSASSSTSSSSSSSSASSAGLWSTAGAFMQQFPSWLRSTVQKNVFAGSQLVADGTMVDAVSSEELASTWTTLFTDAGRSAAASAADAFAAREAAARTLAFQVGTAAFVTSAVSAAAADRAGAWASPRLETRLTDDLTHAIDGLVAQAARIADELESSTAPLNPKAAAAAAAAAAVVAARPSAGAGSAGGRGPHGLRLPDPVVVPPSSFVPETAKTDGGHGVGSQGLRDQESRSGRSGAASSASSAADPVAVDEEHRSPVTESDPVVGTKRGEGEGPSSSSSSSPPPSSSSSSSRADSRSAEESEENPDPSASASLLPSAPNTSAALALSRSASSGPSTFLAHSVFPGLSALSPVNLVRAARRAALQRERADDATGLAPRSPAASLRHALPGLREFRDSMVAVELEAHCYLHFMRAAGVTAAHLWPRGPRIGVLRPTRRLALASRSEEVGSHDDVGDDVDESDAWARDGVEDEVDPSEGSSSPSARSSSLPRAGATSASSASSVSSASSALARPANLPDPSSPSFRHAVEVQVLAFEMDQVTEARRRGESDRVCRRRRRLFAPDTEAGRVESALYQIAVEKLGKDASEADEACGVCAICLETPTPRTPVVVSSTPECARHHKYHKHCLHLEYALDHGCPWCRRPVYDLAELEVPSPFIAFDAPRRSEAALFGIEC